MSGEGRWNLVSLPHLFNNFFKGYKMEKEQILKFLEQVDVLLSKVVNPALNRNEHIEIAKGMKATYEYIQKSEIKEEPNKE